MEREKGATINRNNGIELLRIVSMLMIITLHYLGHGGILINVKLFSFNYILAWSLEALAFVSVNCYVLISGYFLVDSKFKIRKMLKIWIEVLFYSIFIYILMLLIDNKNINIKNIVMSILPVLSKSYWFATTYIALYCLFPFLNILIKSMSKRELQILLALLVFMFSIWPNLMPFSKTLESGGGVGIAWFICLYFISAYVRLYFNLNIKKRIYLISYFICSLLIVLSKVILEYLAERISVLSKGTTIFYQYNSVLVLVSSISLFMFFINIRIESKDLNKIILKFSSTTFGVYLIHDNNFIRNILWSKIVCSSQYANTDFFISHVIISVIIIYSCCSLIDFFRKIIFAKIESIVMLYG